MDEANTSKTTERRIAEKMFLSKINLEILGHKTRKKENERKAKNTVRRMLYVSRITVSFIPSEISFRSPQTISQTKSKAAAGESNR
ncbi:hypothetical protein CDAR_190471 [Caerostris darwini]|uniref:Uncharacterized protein n=1 Tax=Caerostris darwini TaxID=1538125 RepID=A0AAV4MNF9_9ARAC|nr:hypothetical protein CDAR_190471 [Caerostris darwini]